MTASHPDRLVLDNVVIDFVGRRVIRDGIEQPLEAKAFAVLALLAAAPGQVFSRDAILDAVWEHRHITPGVLNRVIALLRQALGENAQQPRLLHTLHGIGYRFDLPAAGRSPMPEASSEPAESEASVTASAPTRRHIGWIALGVAIPGLLVGMLWWHARVQPGLPLEPSSTPTPTLIVMPLNAISGRREDRTLAAGLSDELIGTLARVDGLRVIARESTSLASADADDLATLVARLRISHALEGSVRQEIGQLRISFRLVDARSGQTLWSENFDRQFEDIFAVQSELAHAVANALQLQLLPAGISGESPELYRRFLLARQPFLANQDYEAAALSEAALRALVQEHPAYARGWGGLAKLQYLRALRPRSDRAALLADAGLAAAHALALDPDQTDALEVLAGQACREWRWQECLQRSQNVVQLAPSEAGARSAYAGYLATMGYLDRALIEIERASAIDPASPMQNLVRGRVLDTLGRHDEASAALVLVDPMLAQTARLFNALWRADLAEARRITEGQPADFHWRESQLAALDALQDPSQWPRAMASIELSERTPSRDLEVASYNFMRLWLPERDYPRDIAALVHVQQVGYASYHLVFWQPGERALRQHPAFKAYVRDSGLLQLWRSEGWPPLCRAVGDDEFTCD